MTNRIILGSKGTDVGLWISVPGKNVATATAQEDFLINTTKTNLKPVRAGIITNPTLTYNSALSTPATRTVTANGQSPATATPGHAVYTKYYNHNLGYIPVAFFSIGSDIAGEIYPTVKITSSQVILYHREIWGAGTTNFITWDTYNNYYEFKVLASKPSTLTYSCDIHYTLYNQSTGL